MIDYITKSEMTDKFGKNYFGLTEHFAEQPAKVYIRNDLPKCVQQSVLGHEMQHVKDGLGGPEWKAWIAGFKASPRGWVLGVLMSLTLSRLKMYPALTSAFVLFVGFCLLVYFKV